MLEQEFYEQGDIWRPERWLQGLERQRLNSCVEMLPNGLRSLLDVGAGNGAFLHLVEQSGVELSLAGVERSSKAIATSVCKTMLTQASADDMPFQDKEFELVAVLEVLEHLPWGIYERTLQELQRIASKYILVDVPYRERRLQVFCPCCGCRFNPHFHMRSFDERRLARLFPHFRLVCTRKIFRRESLLAVASRPFRRRVFGGFPTTAICPQCGYRATSSTGQNIDGFRRNIVHTVARMMPKLTIPTEIVALYERVA